MNVFQFGLSHLLQLQMCVYSYTWMPSQWKLVFYKNNNKKMEIVHMTRRQNSFSEVQSIVHEKMDT